MCVAGGVQKLRRRNELPWSLRSDEHQGSMVFRAWVGFTSPVLVSLLVNPYFPGCHGWKWPWSRTLPEYQTRPWHYPLLLREPLCNTEHQNPAVDSCVQGKNAAASIENFVAGFLWWIATKWSHRNDVSHNAWDLPSVSYFLCSWVAKEYLTIQWFNTGWVFLSVHWESYFLDLVKDRVPNTGGADSKHIAP